MANRYVASSQGQDRGRAPVRRQRVSARGTRPLRAKRTNGCFDASGYERQGSGAQRVLGGCRLGTKVRVRRHLEGPILLQLQRWTPTCGGQGEGDGGPISPAFPGGCAAASTQAARPSSWRPVHTEGQRRQPDQGYESSSRKALTEREGGGCWFPVFYLPEYSGWRPPTAGHGDGVSVHVTSRHAGQICRLWCAMWRPPVAAMRLWFTTGSVAGRARRSQGDP